MIVLLLFTSKCLFSKFSLRKDRFSDPNWLEYMWKVKWAVMTCGLYKWILEIIVAILSWASSNETSVSWEAMHTDVYERGGWPIVSGNGKSGYEDCIVDDHNGAVCWKIQGTTSLSGQIVHTVNHHIHKALVPLAPITIFYEPMHGLWERSITKENFDRHS